MVVGMRRALRVALAFVLAALVCTAAACGSKEPALPSGTLLIRAAGRTVAIRVEIADTGAARQKGLMGRSELGADAGMVFLFDAPSTGGFWMKDTLIPLDIAFRMPGGQITDILHMTPCRSEPCRLYVPARPYVGAVEVNRSFFDRHGISVGDTIRLDRS
jgi:uncharacterized membrane protein (UPF0127 family)